MTFSELSELLSHVTDAHEKKAKLICEKYKNIAALADASVSELSEALEGDMKTTVYIIGENNGFFEGFLVFKPF